MLHVFLVNALYFNILLDEAIERRLVVRVIILYRLFNAFTVIECLFLVETPFKSVGTYVIISQYLLFVANSHRFPAIIKTLYLIKGLKLFTKGVDKTLVKIGGE
jgi:hypothetical protein